MKSTRYITALIMLLLCLCTGALADTAYQLGDTVEDFTITTCDGKTMTLSDILKEKEAVLIKIWATWCGPCETEFPAMQQAYEQYADRVEILSLSSEPTDTDDVLSAYAAQRGLTFPMGQDTANLAYRFSASSIPTHVLIDRYGVVCYNGAGAWMDVSYFSRLFDAFLGEDYSQSLLLTDIPPAKPTVTPSTQEELNAALNAEGGTLTFTGGSGAYDWPMIAGEKDSRSVVASSNKGMDGTTALVSTTVSGQAGDAIAVTFKVSSAAGKDLMQIAVNGQVVKSFGGEDGWMTWAWEIPAGGDYAVTVSYANLFPSYAGEDNLWVDSIAHLTGDDAHAALAANPAYPIQEQAALRIVNDGARNVTITDPTGLIAMYYGGTFHIANSDVPQFEIALSADLDPEEALVYCNYDSSIHVLADCLTDGRYLVSCGCNSVATTGYCDNSLYLYPSVNDSPVMMLTYFRDEENLNTLVSLLTVNSSTGEVQGSWAYADAAAAAAVPATESTYVVKYVDQNGNPVPGVMCQICDESTCQVFVSDENGLCTFTLAPYAWEIHTMMAPDGYTADTSTVTIAPVEGGEMVFVLTKN